MNLLYSLYVYSSFKIDPYHENTSDKAVYLESYYSNKAPLTAVIAAPAFTLAMQVSYWRGWNHTRMDDQYLISWLTTVFSVGLWGAAGFLAMYYWLSRQFDVQTASFVSYTVYLGSLPFPYATILLSHSLCITFILLSLIFIRDVGVGDASKRSRWRCDLLAGCCAGLSISCEYSSGIVALSVGFILLMRGTRHFYLFLAGLLCGASFIPFYSMICFQNPFLIGYDLPARFVELNQGFYGITFPPELENMVFLLFSSARGLLFYTPLFLLSFFGIYHSYRKDQISCAVWGCCCLLHFILISGYWEPPGGLVIGPRYLAPLIPFLSYFCACYLRRGLWLAIPLGLISIFVTLTVTFSGAQLSGGAINVVQSIALPKIFNGVSASVVDGIGVSSSLTYLFFLLVDLAVYALIAMDLVSSAKRQAPQAL